jgi:hypothetical protein
MLSSHRPCHASPTLAPRAPSRSPRQNQDIAPPRGHARDDPDHEIWAGLLPPGMRSTGCHRANACRLEGGGVSCTCTKAATNPSCRVAAITSVSCERIVGALVRVGVPRRQTAHQGSRGESSRSRRCRSRRWSAVHYFRYRGERSNGLTVRCGSRAAHRRAEMPAVRRAPAQRPSSLWTQVDSIRTVSGARRSPRSSFRSVRFENEVRRSLR